MSCDPNKWGSKEALREWRMSPITQSMLVSMQADIGESKEGLLRAALTAKSQDDVANLRGLAMRIAYIDGIFRQLNNVGKGEDDE